MEPGVEGRPLGWPQMIRWAWEQGEALGLSGPETAVLTCLASHVNGFGAAFPSAARIGRMTGYSERTVRRSLDSLVAHGLIQRQSMRGLVTVWLVGTPDTVTGVAEPDRPGTLSADPASRPSYADTVSAEVVEVVEEKKAASSSTQRDRYRGRGSPMRGGSAAEHGPTSTELERW